MGRTMRAVEDQGTRPSAIPALPAATYAEGHARGGKVKEPWHPAQTGAKRAKDGQWYLPDPDRAGKYLRVEMKRRATTRAAS